MGTATPAKRLMLSGFARWYHEGVQFWSRKGFHAIINPRGESHELKDPDVQQALQELVAEGRIRLIGEDEKFLEVLTVEGL